MLASTGRDGHLRFWAVASGTPLGDVAGRGAASGLSFGAGGSLASATWPKEERVRVVSVPSGREIETLEIDVDDSAISPDGTRIALAGGAGAVVLDLATRALAFELVPSSGNDDTYGIGNVAWSPDGRDLATIGLGGLDLWDADSGELLSYQPQGWGSDLAWSGDSSLLVSGGPTVRTWRVDALGIERVSTLSVAGTTDGVGLGGLSVSPDGSRVIASGEFGSVTQWDVGVQGDAEWAHLEALPWFGSARFLPDGSFVAVDPAGQLTVWDPRSGQPLRTVGPPLNGEMIFEVSPEGLVALPNGSRHEMWDLVAGVPRYEMPEAGDVVWSPDGARFLIGDRVYERSGREVAWRTPSAEGSGTSRGAATAVWWPWRWRATPRV